MIFLRASLLHASVRKVSHDKFQASPMMNVCLRFHALCKLVHSLMNIKQLTNTVEKSIRHRVKPTKTVSYCALCHLQAALASGIAVLRMHVFHALLDLTLLNSAFVLSICPILSPTLTKNSKCPCLTTCF